MARDVPGTGGNHLSRTSAVHSGTADLALALWVRLDATGGVLIYQGDGAANGYGIDMSGNKLRVNRGGVEQNPVGATDVTTSVWHHAAMTRSASGSWLLYLDGVQDGSDATGSANAPGAFTGVGVGNSGGSPTSPINGRVAEAAVWSAGLSAAEVAALAKGISPALIRRASLVAYWPLFGAGSPEADLAGSALNLTVTGTVPATDHAPVGRMKPVAA